MFFLFLVFPQTCSLNLFSALLQFFYILIEQNWCEEYEQNKKYSLQRVWYKLMTNWSIIKSFRLRIRFFFFVHSVFHLKIIIYHLIIFTFAVSVYHNDILLLHSDGCLIFKINVNNIIGLKWSHIVSKWTTKKIWFDCTGVTLNSQFLICSSLLWVFSISLFSVLRSSMDTYFILFRYVFINITSYAYTFSL